MAISPRTPHSSPRQAAQVPPGQPTSSQILHCRSSRLSCRGWFLLALLACSASRPVLMSAQQDEERPQITPGERKAPRKKDAGPRGIGVLQISANGKSTLIPVAILTGGKFWDASAYKADPIPMALESGTVYEAERSGSSAGLFTVSSALHSTAANVATPWIGTGKWVPAGTESAATGIKAETVPVGIDTGDGAPRPTRDPPKKSAPPDAAPKTTPASTSSPSSPSTSPQSSQPSGSGDEPPRISKGTAPPSDSPSEGQSQPASGTAAPPQQGGSKPSDSKPAGASPDTKPDERSKVPQSDSGAAEGNRPTLRRGKPVEPLPDDDVPGYSKPGTARAAASSTKPGESAKENDMGPLQSLPAISDASGPEPRSFAFQWLKDEEGERLQQMTTLAKEQVRAYVDARAKAKLVPKPAGSQAARHSAVAKAKDPILENVKMTAYDLWTNNQPVIVFSADAHMPPPAAGTPFSATDSELQYSIVLVAYPDTYNNLHKIYSGVTDKYHLDLTPRLELIDAVDADGDRRGELLFREIADGATGWIIYRASPDKLWKMFDSLHPE